MIVNANSVNLHLLPSMQEEKTSFYPGNRAPQSSRNTAFKQRYLEKLQQKLHEEKNTMSMVKRTSMEHTIADLQQSIETPADKIRRLQEQMTEFQQRADSFPAESIDHKIISQAIAGLRQRIEQMQSSDAMAEGEQIYRDQVNNGTDGFALFVEE